MCNVPSWALGEYKGKQNTVLTLEKYITISLVHSLESIFFSFFSPGCLCAMIPYFELVSHHISIKQPSSFSVIVRLDVMVFVKSPANKGTPFEVGDAVLLACQPSGVAREGGAFSRPGLCRLS